MKSGLPAAPPRAARRGAWRHADLVALDFEATGLDFGKDTLVSYGTVPVHRARIDVGDVTYQLVDPGSVEVSPTSVVIHMLRPVDLVGAATLEEAKDTLRRRIASRFLLAWWAPVEAGFLDQLFGGGLGTWMRRAIDVRDLLLALEGEAAARLTLSAAAERHHVPVASPHEALDDALVTAQLFLVLATKLGDRMRTIRDLQALAPKQGSHGVR